MGDRPVVFNFFRNLRSLIEELKPNHVVFALEGRSARKDEFREYKANQALDIDQTDPESLKRFEEEKKFFKQVDECVDLMRRAMPIQVCRHPRFEADDVIYTLARRFTLEKSTEAVIVSNDTDFIQILTEGSWASERTKIWNPFEKSWIKCPDYDYLTFKALKGDGADNIPGIPGVGEVTAEKLAKSKIELANLLSERKTSEVFERNVSLIKLREINGSDLGDLEVSQCQPDWVEVVGAFKNWQFNSFFKPTKSGKTQWDKFRETFSVLS